MARQTRLDRAIAWMSPQQGLRRARARRMTEALAYEGARAGRRTEGWITTSTSADSEAGGSLQTLRNRARDLVRNNPYAARALDVKVTNTIGVGIVAETANARLGTMWDAFVTTCDADGDHDLYGLQALNERVRSESGEALIRFIPTKLEAGMSVAFKLRVLEPDFIDSSRTGRNAENNNPIRYGIEFDQDTNEIVAYWLFEQHPGEAYRVSNIYSKGWASKRVPADDVIHTFRKQRAGQTRGVTDFAPVMLKARDLDDYDDAELMRKKIEACLATFVITPQGADASTLGPITTDDAGRIETLYPGMVEYLRSGEDVRFAEPKTSGGYAEFERFGLRAIAAGYGVPYELMTGDLSQVNYSSYRAGLVDFRRRVETDQWHIHVPVVCMRIWKRFQAEAVAMRGGYVSPSIVPDWSPPRFELIDPLKETQAELEACLAGFDPWEEIVRRRGWTGEEVLDKIEAWQKKLKERGIVLKSDHRNPKGGGSGKATSPKEPGETPEEEEEVA